MIVRGWIKRALVFGVWCLCGDHALDFGLRNTGEIEIDISKEGRSEGIRK